MKKILGGLLLIFLLSGCFGDSSEVKKAKQELGVVEDSSNDLIKKMGGEAVPSQGNETQSNETTDTRININYLTDNEFLYLDELDYNDFKNGSVKITGTTRGTVDTITVLFTNSDSDFPDDKFELKKFKSGDTTFEYNADSRFKVLDFGKNTYTFIAESGEEKSVLELIVDVTDGESNDDSTEEPGENDELEAINFDKLPRGNEFGDIVKLSEDSFRYSDIRGLEIKKEVLGNLNCGVDDESGEYFISDFLKEQQNSWYYWNTCRDIVKENGVSFYLVRLDGEDYFYEKHYLDTKHGLYGIYEIQTGTGVTKDNIADKNKELKAINANFEQVTTVDNLFKQIVK